VFRVAKHPPKTAMRSLALLPFILSYLQLDPCVYRDSANDRSANCLTEQKPYGTTDHDRSFEWGCNGIPKKNSQSSTIAAPGLELVQAGEEEDWRFILSCQSPPGLAVTGRVGNVCKSSLFAGAHSASTHPRPAPFLVGSRSSHFLLPILDM
jgi:hypothetical protein